MRQECVLLRLVETVHLVDEDDGAPAAGANHLRALDRFADVFHAAEHGRDRDELGVETFGHQQRERGLAHPRRAPQDHRMQAARLKRRTQGFAGAEQVLLTDHVVERFRAQALGERGAPFCLARHARPGRWRQGAAAKQLIVHTPIVAAGVASPWRGPTRVQCSPSIGASKSSRKNADSAARPVSPAFV